MPRNFRQALGKPVMVENKPGAATMLAANQVANAPADGHTLVVLTSIALAINPTLYKQINYDPAGFRADLALCEIAVHPGGPIPTAGEDRSGIHQVRQGSASRR